MKTNNGTPSDFRLRPDEPLVGRIVCHWHRNPLSRQLRDTGRIVSVTPQEGHAIPTAEVEWQSGHRSTLPLSSLLAFDRIAEALAGGSDKERRPEDGGIAEAIRALDPVSAKILLSIVER